MLPPDSLGVACSVMADGISLDTIFFVVKRRLTKLALDSVAGLAEATLNGF